jgi:hypothetical protein
VVCFFMIAMIFRAHPKSFEYIPSAHGVPSVYVAVVVLSCLFQLEMQNVAVIIYIYG